MNPKLFLKIGGTVLVVIGILGLSTWLGKISGAAVFHPPYWINWFHLGFGAALLIIAFSHSLKLQSYTTLFGTIAGITLGLFGLLLGPYLARHYSIPEF